MISIMFSSNNSNKHKVAFYMVLVILLVTLRQCHSHMDDTAEVKNHLSKDLPKNFINTDTSVIRGYNANKRSISERLTEIRQLLRSLVFDWNLGESGSIIGRTFGRIRMMKNILLPVAFLGGFLTAVILGIKMIGIVNMFLIGKLVALNLAFLLGKLIYSKAVLTGPPAQSHYHSHHNYPAYQSHSASYGFADRVENSLPYGRYINQVENLHTSQPEISPQISSNFPSNSPGYSQNLSFAFSHDTPQKSKYGQSSIMSQYLTARNGLQQPQYPQQTPTYFRPQTPQNSYYNDNNPFGGIQMKIPQQQVQQQPTFNQVYNHYLPTKFLDYDEGINNNIQSSNTPVWAIATTPSTGVDLEMINLKEIKPESSLSPLEMEKILTDALARISEKKGVIATTALPQLFRFKRKSTNHHPHINLLRPFS